MQRAVFAAGSATQQLNHFWHCISPQLASDETHKGNLREICQTLSDLACFLGHASFVQSIYRRRSFAPCLPQEYRLACGRAEFVPLTSHLFGDDWEATARTASDRFKQATKLSPNKKSKNFQGRGRRGRSSPAQGRGQSSSRQWNNGAPHPQRFPPQANRGRGRGQGRGRGGHQSY